MTFVVEEDVCYGIRHRCAKDALIGRLYKDFLLFPAPCLPFFVLPALNFKNLYSQMLLPSFAFLRVLRGKKTSYRLLLFPFSVLPVLISMDPSGHE